MRNAVAFADNDVVMIAWSYGTKPAGCMGFALYRIDAQGKETPLPSHAVFPGETIQDGQTTEDYPVQKFYWKDPYARALGDQTGNYSFRYKVVPLQGQPGKLTPMPSLPILTTNEVTVSPQCSPGLSATFNRGLISTQHVSSKLKGSLSAAALKAQISVPGNQLRLDLTGQTLGALKAFVARAAQSGQIYAALYEFTDSELLQSLTSIGSRLNIVLANIAATPPAAGKTPEPPENDAAWAAIQKAKAATGLYRSAPSGHIVHNKFLVYSDASGPQAVLTGSTNWTATGLCAQTNNVLVIDDANVAKRYMAYWNILKADEQAHEKDPKSFQAPPMRSFDAKSLQIPLDAKTTPSTLTSWFSPCTPKPRSKSKTKAEVEPVDMKDLETRILGAQHAVLFLAFIPGTPSVVDFAAEAQKKNKDLFVRGCVTSPDAAGLFYYDLKGITPPKPVRAAKGQPKAPKAPVMEDPRVISAEALTGADAPAGWAAELLKAGFAITHDKIVVIDPFADNCTVVTGSHNLGYQASNNNDENMVMIQGNKKLALAYATHVLDVYDHFSWRWTLKNDAKPSKDASLKTSPDAWLGRYFDAQGNLQNAQLKFWMQATVE
jgi:phosphatidylserine/phosphatidylglycerophosphate/cardiolipin synthase-like enzyme